MFKINDYVLYKRNVCIIKDITLNKFSNKECYILIPIDDSSLKITVPKELGNVELRNIISKKEVEKFIQNIPNIELIETSNEKYMENEYKKLLEDFSHENLIKIIKTSYLRNKMRIDSKKKASETDNMYFKIAEKLLYTEFSLALNMTYDDTKNYIIAKVKESSGNNEEY